MAASTSFAPAWNNPPGRSKTGHRTDLAVPREPGASSVPFFEGDVGGNGALEILFDPALAGDAVDPVVQGNAGAASEPPKPGSAAPVPA